VQQKKNKKKKLDQKKLELTLSRSHGGLFAENWIDNCPL
jgi:hypothetical protein